MVIAVCIVPHVCFCLVDTPLQTIVSDLYPVDISSLHDSSVSAPATLSIDSNISFQGSSQYQRLLSVPIVYTAKPSDVFSVVITYNGKRSDRCSNRIWHSNLSCCAGSSSLTPYNNMLLGLTNGSCVWLGGRFYTYQQGYYTSFVSPNKTGNLTAVGPNQAVSVDNDEPYDVSWLWRVCCVFFVYHSACFCRRSIGRRNVCPVPLRNH